jgi:hypothetical protein
MLNQQTIDKLHALRLEAMVQALQEQRQQSNICQLDFEDRLALLVERQWLWKDHVKRLVMWSDGQYSRLNQVSLP